MKLARGRGIDGGWGRMLRMASSIFQGPSFRAALPVSFPLPIELDAPFSPTIVYLYRTPTSIETPFRRFDCVDNFWVFRKSLLEVSYFSLRAVLTSGEFSFPFSWRIFSRVSLATKVVYLDWNNWVLLTGFTSLVYTILWMKTFQILLWFVLPPTWKT